MSNRHELTARERIEESHGHWEFCIVRVNALVGALTMPVTPEQFGALKDAFAEERDAYYAWQKINNAVTE